jgi:hypothetical protein
MGELTDVLDIASRTGAMLLGIALFLIALVSLFRTIVIPRALNSTLSQLVMAAVLLTARGIARLRRTYKGRDAVLAWSGPTFLFVILLTWLMLFMISYALMIYAISPKISLGAAVRQSGSSLFTLGFAGGRGTEQTFIDFAAAATGPIVIALMIGVLATIYGIYLDREKNVGLLGGVAGEPSWGPELLCRTALANNVSSLTEMFSGWAAWATSVRISHQTYPMLIYVRSPGPRAGYAVALLAVLDAAAMKIAVNTSLPRTGSFTLLLDGSMTMETLYEQGMKQQSPRASIPLSLHLFKKASITRVDETMVDAVSPEMQAAQTAAARDALADLSPTERKTLESGESQPLQLTREEFSKAYALVKGSGFPVERSEDEAWPIFSAARKRYEFPALQLMKLTYAVPAPWAGDRHPTTPTIWPNLSVQLLAEMAANAASPDDSTTPPEPDAPHQ